MLKFIVILAFCFITAAANTARGTKVGAVEPTAILENERIIGGSLVTAAQLQVSYPFSASFLYASNGVTFRQTCGGTLINSRSILTAIVCWFNDPHPDKYMIRVGSLTALSGGNNHRADKLISHPNYNSWNRNNNIGILRVTGSVTLGAFIRPARLAGSGFNLRDNVDWLGVDVIAIGWGRTTATSVNSDALRHVAIATVTPARCREIYGVNFITPNMICAGWTAGGRGSCDGDLGSPIIFNNTAVGITSFILGCGDGSFPPVYTRISHYTNWILTNA